MRAGCDLSNYNSYAAAIANTSTSDMSLIKKYTHMTGGCDNCLSHTAHATEVGMFALAALLLQGEEVFCEN